MPLLGVALLAGGCAGTAGHAARAPTAAGAPRRSTTTLPPAGAWSGAIRVAPGADLSVVSCGASGSCLVGSVAGASYRLSGRAVVALPPAVASPAPQGPSWLACAGAFCAAAADADQVALLEGTAWSAPATLPGAQGITAVACTGASFCVVIDGEGNSFAYDGQGWSGNLGAWGAANQISCTSASFCVAAEGGPSVWDGDTWTRPGEADDQGQLNAVSCATPAFCALVDSNGDVLSWNGSGFSAPQRIATEPATAGSDTSGLTGVSCPTPSFCQAVDSLGRVFAWNGTAWSAGTVIDPGHALSSVSCPTTSYCVAVDRAGNAFVST